jgi:hypothetical protein
MQACVAGFALIYLATPKLQLPVVSWSVVGLTAAKFRPLILFMSGFSSSSTMHIWIYVVWDYLQLCPA